MVVYTPLIDTMWHSGAVQVQRQMNIVREGLTQPRMSSVLGIGRSDLPSVGVDEQFTKSTYNPSAPCPLEGLSDVIHRPRPTKIVPADTYIKTLSDSYYTRKINALASTMGGGSSHGGNGDGDGHSGPNPLRPVSGIKGGRGVPAYPQRDGVGSGVPQSSRYEQRQREQDIRDVRALK